MTIFAPTQTNWGITWSKRWHALVPGDSGIRNEPATVCGGYAYKLDGPDVPAHILRAASDPRTPVCKRCIAAVGPMPKHATHDSAGDIETVDAINALASLIREIDGDHTLGAAALAEALVGRGVTVSAPRVGSETSTSTTR